MFVKLQLLYWCCLRVWVALLAQHDYHDCHHHDNDNDAMILLGSRQEHDCITKKSSNNKNKVILSFTLVVVMIVILPHCFYKSFVCVSSGKAKTADTQSYYIFFQSTRILFVSETQMSPMTPQKNSHFSLPFFLFDK